MSREQFLQFVRATDARSDRHLDLYCVETRSLRRLADFNDRAFLGIGLKGVGKTAGFLHLQRERGADLVQPISLETQEPHDASGIRPTLQYVPEIRSELVLQALITFHKACESDSALAAKVTKALRKDVDKFVLDIWGKAKEMFGSLGGVTVLGVGMSLRTKTAKKPGFQFVARDESKQATVLLKRLTETLKIRIVIDDPEAIFTTDERLNENLVAALAMAAHDLHVDTPGLKCIVLIKPNVFRALLRVDEFVNIPSDVRLNLSWQDDELKQVIVARAQAAGISLKAALGTELEPVLRTLIADSRSGPRDMLVRLTTCLEVQPDGPVTDERLATSLSVYSDACYEQMYGAYERQYPGLCRATELFFSGAGSRVSKADTRMRLDQLLATETEFLAYQNESWARDSNLFESVLIFVYEA